MDENFRTRLSFSGQSAHRENWSDALALLQDPACELQQNQQILQQLLTLPTRPEVSTKTSHLEWILSEDSQPTRAVLIPCFVDGHASFRVPSLSHLLNHLDLGVFDRAWAIFFMNHFGQYGDKIELGFGDAIQSILLTLAEVQRLRLPSDDRPLQVAQPLRFEAQLRFAQEWGLWAVDANLISPDGLSIAPESLDFIASSGLAAFGGKLFPLPVGAQWIAQLSTSGAWYVAKENLAEMFYQLSKKIGSSEFLRDLPEVSCVQGVALPVVYLRSKNFDKDSQVSLYLAYRYGPCEVFSAWHGEGGEDLPIGFETYEASCILHFRDLAAEAAIETKLRHQEGMEFIAGKRCWAIQISVLWQKIHEYLSLGWEVWAEKIKIEELSSFGMEAISGIGWFDLQSFDKNTGQKIDPLQLIKYLKRKALFIRLGQDRICVLPEHWIAHLMRFLGLGNLEEDKSWRFSSLYTAEVEDTLGNEAGFHADAAFHATLERIRSFDRVEPLQQPEGLRAILRSYQLTGLTWLNLLCDLGLGGILADDMGLGKTVQILALLQHRIINQADLPAQTILVICPKSVQAHWFAQAKNLVPRLQCRILKSGDLTEACRCTQHTLLIASYGLVRFNLEALMHWKFDLLILDEAQTIKNDKSQIAQSIKQLSAVQRFALTGTPIENRFEELVSIFTFLNPYAQLNLGPAATTADALRSLVQRALHPFVLRRLKEDVLPDLPVKTVHEVALTMEPEQGRLHQELLEVYRQEMAKIQHSQTLPTEHEAAFFLEGLMRLRQAATYPQQLTQDAFYDCVSNKVQYLCAHLPQLIANGQRIVVFSQFLGFLRGLAKEINRLEIRYSYVDGETPEREREIALFQTNTAIKVLLISLRVGGIGIDLTAADVCILADPWWNDAVEKQAIDRLHRFGQKKPVTVFRLISTGSIEEKMEIMKKNKSELADALGKTNPDFLENLKWEDFAEIF